MKGNNKRGKAVRKWLHPPVIEQRPVSLIERKPPAAPEERFLLTGEVARMLRLAESTLVVARCTKTGIQIPFLKVGGRVVYDRADVERYIQQNKRVQTEGCPA